LVLEYNGSEAWVRRHWGNGRLVGLVGRAERYVLRRASLVLAISEPLRRELGGYGVEPNRIALAPNGVDIAEFDPHREASAREELKRRYALDPAAPVVGFLGTFGPWHGTEVLAEAIPLVLAQRSETRFLIVGDGGSRRAFEERVRELGAGGSVVMTGAVSRDQVPAHLAACDVLVSPHVPMPDGRPFFGSPTKLFEYMAMGRPIVASRLDQLAEVLQDGRNAVLVTPGDARDLARGVGWVLSHAEAAVALGDAARRDALAHHSWTGITARWLQWFEGHEQVSGS
jgi:glycosyltransferase involved in cell wall biosynthesis